MTYIIDRDFIEVEFKGTYGKFEYKTMYSVGADLVSQDFYVLHPGERQLISTGVYITNFRLAVFDGQVFSPELQVRPKSSLSLKGIDAAFGTIDPDYRNEIKACLINNSKDTFVVNHGDRVGQLVAAMILNVKSIMRKTDERVGGFGSTSTK